MRCVSRNAIQTTDVTYSNVTCPNSSAINDI